MTQCDGMLSNLFHNIYRLSQRYPCQDGKTDGSETLMNENQKLYYHRVGQSQDQDVLVVEFLENPTWRMYAQVSDCGKYLFVSIIKDCRDNLVYFADLEAAGTINGKLKITPIVTKFESDYYVRLLLNMLESLANYCVMHTTFIAIFHIQFAVHYQHGLESDFPHE